LSDSLDTESKFEGFVSASGSIPSELPALGV
jgi:hypothetical protein